MQSAHSSPSNSKINKKTRAFYNSEKTHENETFKYLNS
jgi:hypothetical protein